MNMMPVVKKAKMRDLDNSYEDMQFWLTKTPQERIAAVTQLRKGFLQDGQRMDRTVVVKRKLHDWK